MQTVLFHQTIFGPIHSRRLGISLGVNLTPTDGKICTFDCLYCEAGFNAQGPGKTGMPTRREVAGRLEERLRDMRGKNEKLDVITFSGNGEPTLHRDFAGIIDDTIALRDKYFPEVKISVLTNSTQLEREDVVAALRRVDNNILKLDSAIDSTMRALDRPTNPAYDVERAIAGISRFAGTGIVQTMITRGTHNGIAIDNSTEAEVDALTEAYGRIKPASVMLYSIDRKTPEQSMEKIDRETLLRIADHITSRTGIPVSVW